MNLEQRNNLERAVLIQREIQRRGNLSTVVGFVSPNTNSVTCAYKFSSGMWQKTRDSVSVLFPEILLPMFLRPKKFIILVGGRGSGKSISKGDHGLIMMSDLGRNMMCIREFQSSISDSVHALLREEVERLEFKGFDIKDRTIECNSAVARFQGLSRHPESVKSAFGFLDWWIEEAQFLSEGSLRTLTPTGRKRPKKGLPGKQVEVDGVDLDGVQMVFCANPASSEDPFSQRFLVPFQADLDEKGIYEDDMHLIIKMNWSDNPWFKDSGLEKERLYDKKTLPRSTYDWIWEGGYNDEIENGLIKPEWFDACIDAHLKLKIKPYGVKKVVHDPSDLGSDPKSLLVREGNIITSIFLRHDLDVNEGGDWAVGLANEIQADQFIWDVGGMGITLKRDINNALKGKMRAFEFNGASSPDNGSTIFQPSSIPSGEKTWKETCKNLRSQCYLKVRERIFRTYQAVINGVMCDPDEIISISSDCEAIKTLRAELCKMPIKPNSSGLFELYSKQEMRSKFKLRSPNCADVLMMSERVHDIISNDIDLDELYATTESDWA